MGHTYTGPEKPDKLSEALTRLCLMALNTYQDRHEELVADFLRAHPEIRLAGGLKDAAKLVLRESERAGNSTVLSGRAHNALAKAYAQAGGVL